MNAHVIATALGALLLAGTAYAGDGNTETGKQLYISKLCNSCHTLAGESGPMAQLGGPLDGVGTKRDAAWLQRYLQDPATAIPDTKMPKADLTGQEVKDLAAYLLTR